MTRSLDEYRKAVNDRFNSSPTEIDREVESMGIRPEDLTRCGIEEAEQIGGAHSPLDHRVPCRSDVRGRQGRRCIRVRSWVWHDGVATFVDLAEQSRSPVCLPGG